MFLARKKDRLNNDFPIRLIQKPDGKTDTLDLRGLSNQMQERKGCSLLSR